ncbi:alpha/beta hydrolase [beta proteobacterium AAP99]|nr:alpha/beta hydrolase [beta proteobacterium AAP99]
MSPATETLLLPGAAGPIEVAIDTPAEPASGVVVVAHPHPLFGGTMNNKVVTTVARAAVAAGRVAVRLNFRGIGASGGEFDQGTGETDDFLQVVEHVRARAPQRLVLAGFSFGGFVAASAFARLQAATTAADQLVLLGPATSRFKVPEVPAETLVIHGEHDDVVPLASVLDWARPQELPVIVVPGSTHYFDRKLTVVKRLVQPLL